MTALRRFNGYTNDFFLPPLLLLVIYIFPVLIFSIIETVKSPMMIIYV